MPVDYLHLLNCICVYYVAKQKDCWDAGSYIQVPATRLTADSWSQIITDIYNRPSPMRPYYYIHNQSSTTNYPNNPVTYDSKNDVIEGIDMADNYKVLSNGLVVAETASGALYGMKDNEWHTVQGLAIEDGQVIRNSTVSFAILDGKLDLKTDSIKATYMYYPAPEETTAYVGKSSEPNESGVANSNLPRTIKLKLQKDVSGKTTTVTSNVSLVEKPIALRAGNPSQVRMEIRYGRDDSLFQLKEVQVDYVKSPQFIRLTQEQIDLTEDTSQIMEFPDYVNQEIINELVHLVMEHSNDPRLSNNIQMTNSIARPTGQQAQQAQA